MNRASPSQQVFRPRQHERRPVLLPQLLSDLLRPVPRLRPPQVRPGGRPPALPAPAPHHPRRGVRPRGHPPGHRAAVGADEDLVLVHVVLVRERAAGAAADAALEPGDGQHDDGGGGRVRVGGQPREAGRVAAGAVVQSRHPQGKRTF